MYNTSINRFILDKSISVNAFCFRQKRRACLNFASKSPISSYSAERNQQYWIDFCLQNSIQLAIAAIALRAKRMEDRSRRRTCRDFSPFSGSLHLRRFATSLHTMGIV